MTLENEEVLISKLTQLTLDHCSYRVRHSFNDSINDALFPESSIRKKTILLEKMIDQRSGLLKNISDWNRYTPDNYQETIRNLIVAKVSSLKIKVHFSEDEIRQKGLQDYCRKLYNVIQKTINSIDDFWQNETPESKKPYKISVARLRALEKLIKEAREITHNDISQISIEYKDIESNILEVLGDFDTDLDDLFEWLYKELKAEPKIRTGISDVDGVFYINPITYFINSSISNLRDYQSRLNEVYDKIEYRINNDILNSIIPFEEQLEIRNTIKVTHEIYLLNQRLLELGVIKPTNFTTGIKHKESGLPKDCFKLTAFGKKEFKDDVRILGQLLIEGGFIEKIHGNTFKTIFDSQTLIAPCVDWKQQVQMLYFIKLLWDNDIVEKSPKSRFNLIPNIFLIKGEVITPKKQRSLSAQFDELETKSREKKQPWQIRLDKIFDSILKDFKIPLNKKH